MYPRAASCCFFLLSTLFFLNANASVVLECDRPEEIQFDHAQTPKLEAVITANEMLKQYGVEAQAYIKCLQRQIISERDEILAEIKTFRKKNAEFRKAYINK